LSAGTLSAGGLFCDLSPVYSEACGFHSPSRGPGLPHKIKVALIWNDPARAVELIKNLEERLLVKLFGGPVCRS
jgi:hypothetical protein